MLVVPHQNAVLLLQPLYSMFGLDRHALRLSSMQNDSGRCQDHQLAVVHEQIALLPAV